MTSASRPGPSDKEGVQPRVIQFDDNSLLPLLFGEHDQNLARLEKQLGVSLVSRGNRLAIQGPEDSALAAGQALEALYERLKKGMQVGDAVVRMARSGSGPAGTGKTYLAVAKAVALLMSGEVDRLILSRPAVEAGERLGFLPGDLREKIDPYLRPLYDALYEMLPAEQVVQRLANGEIEVAPLAFMRGRTLSNSFIILDEAQNSTPVQMKMFLTRLGENSRMAVTGDLSQVDLPQGQGSGLRDAVDLLAGLEGVACVQFTDQDVVRHPLVTRVVQAYEARDTAVAARDGDLFEGRGGKA